MKARQHQSESAKLWQKTQFANLVRFVPSGMYFARLRVAGKLIRRSLKTDRISVAQLKLADLQRDERKKAEAGRIAPKSRITFADALAAYKARAYRPVKSRNQKDARPLKPAALAYYDQRSTALLKSWPLLGKIEIRSLTERTLNEWASRARNEMSATVFNHTVGMIRNVIDYGIDAGARYDNPAKAIMRQSEAPKALELPDASTFEKFVAEIEQGGGGYSKHCADLVRFLAFGGLRIGEAKHVTWADCDLDKGQIVVRGHPETGLKNRRPGEVRRVPMIPEMQQLLERLRKNGAGENDPVMTVFECQKAMDRAAKVIKMKRITHHDLRHLFATTAIESGIDVPTISRWLGHKDGGALAMRTYGHLRDQHSSDMAKRVQFIKTVAENVVPMRKEGAA
jgi:integrase